MTHIPLSRAQSIADLALSLGEVRRATRHPDGAPETDTTHTVMLALLAADIAPLVGVDPGEAVLFALVHDLPEAYAGDTNTARALGPAAAKAKAQREAVALNRIRTDLVQSPWIADRIAAYEEQHLLAARLVRYLDKVCPKLTHRRNACAAVRDIGMTREEVIESHAKQGKALAEQYPGFSAIHHLFEAACDACVAAYPTT